MNFEKIFKEEESNEILKMLGLIINIEEYQKTYNHVWRKYKSRICTDISAFASLVGIPVRIMSSAVELKIYVIIAGIK